VTQFDSAGWDSVRAGSRFALAYSSAALEYDRANPKPPARDGDSPDTTA
jgi:hypothetical protein